MNTFSYGDVVAFQHEDSLRYGVVTAVIDREDANGKSAKIEVSINGQTTITVDAKSAETIPSATYSSFDRLVCNHPRAKWAREQSEKLLNPEPGPAPVPVDPLRESADSLRDLAPAPIAPTESAAGSVDNF